MKGTLIVMATAGICSLAWLFTAFWIRLYHPELGGIVVAVIGDAWDHDSRRLAGWRAVECGRVLTQTDPVPATNCALQAFWEKKPFRLRYDLQGIDSQVSAGVVGTPDGRVFFLSFDGDPYGGGGVSILRQRVWRRECPEPISLRTTPRGHLTCFPPSPPRPANIMDPTWEPY
jgi:hypothetical protein